MTDHDPLPPTADKEPENYPVVGIGASAGGLEACRRLVDALPAVTGMAFILVQHLDPTHESMMVDLLADHTALTVRQATDGMRLAREHLTIIPPGTYLSVADGALQLSLPQARHGARLPFDFLLHAMAAELGARAVCVILSGTGADGSLGLLSVAAAGGLVIAQDPDEAAHGGMPRSAIATGAVDLVLPIAKIPDALLGYARKLAVSQSAGHTAPRGPPADLISAAGLVRARLSRARLAGEELPAERLALERLAPERLGDIVALLQRHTAHDFTHYKSGTLQRRIARRMSLASIAPGGIETYLDRLRNDRAELDALANDLLINVTSFFRDPQVFEVLASTVIPDILRSKAPDQPVRIWVAGCSTGEETYSLAMLFREAISSDHSPFTAGIKLQIFASDVDPDAVAAAREGSYPLSIRNEVSPARLERFFIKDDQGYRVLPELRACVVFTVQDVLADPPFSRIDLVCCRNLLIYLQPEAQAKVIALFHFALRDGGILLLGSCETIGNAGGRFEAIAKAERIFRRVGRRQAFSPGLLSGTTDASRLPTRPGQVLAAPRQSGLAEICRRLVMENYAPAAVLINRRLECLYLLGPTDRFLHIAPGHPSNDLLAMARPGTRLRLRAAIEQVRASGQRALIPGGSTRPGGRTHGEAGPGRDFGIAVHPVPGSDGLLLVCFVEEKEAPAAAGAQPALSADSSAGAPARLAVLEQELEATRIELQEALRNLESANEEQNAIHEEALSVNEEYQSANEELLTSKEELQSLNEELTALNSQLQETLERQRTTANDLQNILYSTDIATLFLDRNLDIRFFTPGVRSFVSLIPGHIGRPLADLQLLAQDPALLDDARTILRTSQPIEREIARAGDTWFIRRILPYRTLDQDVEGVVITFADITARKRAAGELERARQQAEVANVAKSRFLAAASHDLRQPLQTLALLQGLLAKKVEGDALQNLVGLLEPTIDAMSGMLNALLDINQIDAGTLRAEPSDFPIDDILIRLRNEFEYHAQAQGLSLRVVPCRLSVHSDARLLEQMLRNLLSNAFKYTRVGNVLLGCRRRGTHLVIEVHDSGIGIPAHELEAIFTEYHQVDNPARERGRGLGLGLPIVRRLSDLLGHTVQVRSRPGAGSVFAVAVRLAAPAAVPAAPPPAVPEPAVRRSGSILVIEDDPELRKLLELLLTDEGHRVVATYSGEDALELVAQPDWQDHFLPDLILADYNLPGSLDGLQVAEKLRQLLQRQIPIIVLTGDIATETLRKIDAQDCIPFNKPVRPAELTQAVQRLLPAPQRRRPPAADADADPVICIVDDDRHIRAGLRLVLEQNGSQVEEFASGEAFLEAWRPGSTGCLLLDAFLPGMSGMDLLREMRGRGMRMPAIMITGNGDVRMAVAAMQAGAVDFIEKPVSAAELLASTARAMEQHADSSKSTAWRQRAAERLATLTERQRQIMALVLAGLPSKTIAIDLAISQRTVESHRAEIMRKTGAKSIPALARLAAAADRE